MHERRFNYPKNAEAIVGRHGFNIIDITARDIGSYRYTTAIQLLKEAFHGFELCPESDFEYFLNRTENGTMDNDAYYLTVIETRKEIIGVASYFYLSIPNIIFMGYLLVRRDFRGKGLSYVLVENAISRCSAKALHGHEEVPCAIVGDIPRIELGNNILERNKILSRIGFMMLKGINYVQPPEILSNLYILPITDNFMLSVDFVEDIIYYIYTVIYRRRDNLEQILRSIDTKTLSLVPLQTTIDTKMTSNTTHRTQGKNSEVKNIEI